MITENKIRYTVCMPQTMLDKIKQHCEEDNISNPSEYIRNAITKELTPDIDDKSLKFESLKDLHNNQKNFEKDLELIFKYFSYFVKYYMLYAEDIPQGMRDAAALNAGIKYDKFLKGFKNSLKNTPAFFENFMADAFEEK